MNRKTIFTALIVLIGVTACTKQQKPEYEAEENFTVELADNSRSVRIIDYQNYNEDKETIVIPRKIEGFTVTEIGPNAFTDWTFFEVVIPDTVVNIMDWALSGNYIQRMNIPNSVVEIGAGVLMNNKLTTISIPDSVKKIGYRAFSDNPIKSITIGPDVELGMISGHDSMLNTDWRFVAFEMGYDVEFYDAYNTNGRQAGTYTYVNNTWNFKKRG